MNRLRIWTSTIPLLVVVGLGLSACAEPVGYAPADYGYDGYTDGWLGGWDHGGWGHGFEHGHARSGEHGGFAGHGGEGGHGGGGHR